MTSGNEVGSESGEILVNHVCFRDERIYALRLFVSFTSARCPCVAACTSGGGGSSKTSPSVAGVPVIHAEGPISVCAGHTNKQRT